MTNINLSEKREPLFLDYCQFLLAGFQNFTQTYFADHTQKWSHDQLNRFLNTERMPARQLWRAVRNDSAKVVIIVDSGTLLPAVCRFG